MLKMTAELFGEKDMVHSVYLNGIRIGGVYVYQGVCGSHINACATHDLSIKHFSCVTDGVKWLVIKEVTRNEG